MPIQTLVVLLEDFRPLSMRLRKETRKDAYVHKQAFDYALQRIGRHYTESVPGPHLVALDRRDDFASFEEVYSRAHRKGWRFDRGSIEPLSQRGFAASLLTCAHGPLHEIADFIVAGLTLWASVRCCQAKGKAIDKRVAEVATLCAPTVPLLPRRPESGARVGWSVVVHAKALTGKELLRDHAEAWLEELSGATRKRPLGPEPPR